MQSHNDGRASVHLNLQVYLLIEAALEVALQELEAQELEALELEALELEALELELEED